MGNRGSKGAPKMGGRVATSGKENCERRGSVEPSGRAPPPPKKGSNDRMPHNVLGGNPGRGGGKEGRNLLGSG